MPGWQEAGAAAQGAHVALGAQCTSTHGARRSSRGGAQSRRLRQRWMCSEDVGAVAWRMERRCHGGVEAEIKAMSAGSFNILPEWPSQAGCDLWALGGSVERGTRWGARRGARRRRRVEGCAPALDHVEKEAEETKAGFAECVDLEVGGQPRSPTRECWGARRR